MSITHFRPFFFKYVEDFSNKNKWLQSLLLLYLTLIHMIDCCDGFRHPKYSKEDTYKDFPYCNSSCSCKPCQCGNGQVWIFVILRSFGNLFPRLNKLSTHLNYGYVFFLVMGLFLKIILPFYCFDGSDNLWKETTSYY